MSITLSSFFGGSHSGNGVGVPIGVPELKLNENECPADACDRTMAMLLFPEMLNETGWSGMKGGISQKIFCVLLREFLSKFSAKMERSMTAAFVGVNSALREGIEFQTEFQKLYEKQRGDVCEAIRYIQNDMKSQGASSSARILAEDMLKSIPKDKVSTDAPSKILSDHLLAFACAGKDLNHLDFFTKWALSLIVSQNLIPQRKPLIIACGYTSCSRGHATFLYLAPSQSGEWIVQEANMGSCAPPASSVTIYASKGRPGRRWLMNDGEIPYLLAAIIELDKSGEFGMPWPVDNKDLYAGLFDRFSDTHQKGDELPIPLVEEFQRSGNCTIKSLEVVVRYALADQLNKPYGYFPKEQFFSAYRLFTLFCQYAMLGNFMHRYNGKWDCDKLTMLSNGVGSLANCRQKMHNRDLSNTQAFQNLENTIDGLITNANWLLRSEFAQGVFFPKKTGRFLRC